MVRIGTRQIAENIFSYVVKSKRTNMFYACISSGSDIQQIGSIYSSVGVASLAEAKVIQNSFVVDTNGNLIIE